ncbi:hypothetical protein KMW28_21665 [Flammeovirga yaeyamensis]|uniref:Dehydrogenase n=1 Tax=Flammeovirga yaeyamensis TaxID=367791 RepID=A0AAX1NBT3_9BACT|nr:MULTISPECIES: hypothetical protein [Flammeovirga]ANQ52765.1 dehydrogenase [Flammeovirga sp. MY04]MBB3697038.1 SAM-dependent methyltransferase [Flammeovirga yaeyamensis]NMF33700.1 dehydrogenase [Flammeovirga yaeyamensis]QWG05034.1 hypothetical protein KMW28_21665 [Flammeovirga yaeyamensis]
MNRKNFLMLFGLLSTSSIFFPSNLIGSISDKWSNFKHIYSSNKLKLEFFKFLKNVFNLFPEDELHKLISESTNNNSSDKEIYLDTQSKLGDISSFFSVFEYELPSLLKQKEEMAKQSLMLLESGATYNGYLEIGSSGRYLDYLEEKVNIEGNRYYADGKKPGYSLTEMVDRGQIFIGAEYIPLADYNTKYSEIIENESLDLVTVYIGFHHCPVDLRETFISSIRDTMRMGGKLILRDHDCHDKDQETIVALAHDVFNMGTRETWEYNENETRNFYSLDFIIQFIEKIGFQFEKQTLFQDGDPTKNALMLFTKTQTS